MILLFTIANTRRATEYQSSSLQPQAKGFLPSVETDPSSGEAGSRPRLLSSVLQTAPEQHQSQPAMCREQAGSPRSRPLAETSPGSPPLPSSVAIFPGEKLHHGCEFLPRKSLQQPDGKPVISAARQPPLPGGLSPLPANKKDERQ